MVMRTTPTPNGPINTSIPGGLLSELLNNLWTDTETFADRAFDRDAVPTQGLQIVGGGYGRNKIGSEDVRVFDRTMRDKSRDEIFTNDDGTDAFVPADRYNSPTVSTEFSNNIPDGTPVNRPGRALRIIRNRCTRLPGQQ